MRQGYCMDCETKRPLCRGKTWGHPALHFIAALVTGGWWLFGWIACWCSRKYVCSHCATTTKPFAVGTFA